ncbi:hypothetical protein FACS1894176_07120 [Bacteroidia bacterium]|nr:hypothetical protein FACS1894176_07120 [Bacteroidia bacterium]
MITYNTTALTTGKVEVTMTLTDTGSVTTSGRTRIDDITFIKTYSENVTGEIVEFQDLSGGNVKYKTINIRNIIPITTLTYDPAGSTLTTGSVTATIGFNKN